MKTLARVTFFCLLTLGIILTLTESSWQGIPTQNPQLISDETVAIHETTVPSGTENTSETDETAEDSSDTPSSEDSESSEDFIIPLTMYYQNDPQWASYLYGGTDRMASHGCGPTALSILVESLSSQELSPVAAADWAAANGYHAPGGGTEHALIPEGSVHFGLEVEHVTTLSPTDFQLVLSQDKLIVFLMGPGNFTDGGHFIIAHGYTSEGQIIVADPASPDRTNARWDPKILTSEAKKNAKDWGPIWIISN